jgi:hypothetical protein
LQATNSDNVGVVGLQFLLDGSALGQEISSPSGTATYSWNTVGVSNTSHTLAAVARDAVGFHTTSLPVTVTVNNGQPQSLVFPGTGALQLNGAMGNSSFTSVSSFRVETRLHNLATTEGMIWNAGTFSIFLGPSSGSDRWIYFYNTGGAAAVDCLTNIGISGDITLRAQKDSSGYINFSVWDASNALLPGFCWDGITNSTTQQARPGPDNLGGVAGAAHTIGADIYGSSIYHGAMAYFRLFSSSTPSTTPPSEGSGLGSLLSYEFENNLTDSAATHQVLTPSPSSTVFTYTPSGN